MTGALIVPNVLRDAINAKLDEAFGTHPDAAPDREIFYDALVQHYYLYGVIPEFDLIRSGVWPTK